MSRAPIAGDEETIDPLTTSETKGRIFDLRGRSKLAILISTFNKGSMTDLTVKLEATLDKDQWYRVRGEDPDADWSLVLDANINDTSPLSAGEGALIPVFDGTPNQQLAVPAYAVRLSLTGTGSPQAGSILTYRLVAYD